jgi:hypothetical protein
MTNLPISTHFPPSVRDALVRASQTPIPDSDPLARIKAIEQATKRAKQSVPNFFRKDLNHEDQT